MTTPAFRFYVQLAAQVRRPSIPPISGWAAFAERGLHFSVRTSQFYDELSSLDSCHYVASFSSGQVGVKFKRFVSIESDRRKKLRCKATPRC